MKTSLIAAASLLVGAAIGAVAVQGVNAQAGKARVFMISESEIVDKANVAAYEAKLLPAMKAAGGDITLSTNVVPILGNAPQRVGITEYDSVEKAQAWVKSPERQALAPEREKAIKIVRQYIVESK
jgi:uncharacterized protein (DUF1330 family)